MGTRIKRKEETTAAQTCIEETAVEERKTQTMKHRPFKEVIYNEDGTFTLKLDGVVKDKWVILPKGSDRSKHNRAMRRMAVRLWKKKYGETRDAKKFKPDGSINWNCFLVHADRVIYPRPMSLVDHYMDHARKAQADWIDRMILGEFPKAGPIGLTNWKPLDPEFSVWPPWMPLPSAKELSREF